MKLPIAALVGAGLVMAIVYQNCADFASTDAQRASGASSLNTVAPELNILKSPSKISALTTAEFQFASTDPNAKFQCSLNNGGFQDCTSPTTLNGLPDGNNLFAVTATNAGGKKSDPYIYTWQVDRVAPTATISTSMPAYTNLRTASIAFTGMVQGGTIGSYECKVDLLPFAPCTSPYVVNNLNEGDHVVQVIAKDSGGKASSPAAISWRIDITAPTIIISSGPSGNAQTGSFTFTASFGFSVIDSGGSLTKTVTCQLDSGPITACASGVAYSLTADGVAHAFHIRATDNAGNASIVSRTFSMQYVDPNPPGGGSSGDGE